MSFHINHDFFDNPIVPPYILSKSNKERIGTILTSLCNLGFLDRIEEVHINKDAKEYKTTYKYRITTYEEYKLAKRRGTSRKIIK